MVGKKGLLFISLLFVGNLSAQYTSKEKDLKSRFRPGIAWFFTGLRPAETNKDRKYDRLMVDITYNDWTGDLKPFEIKPTSIGMGVSWLFDKPINKDNTMSLGYGLGYQRNNFRYDGAFLADQSKKSTSYFNGTSAKNTLATNTVYLPIELRFRKEAWKHLKLHLGGKIGYNFNLHEKTILKGDFGRTVIKDYQLPDKNPLLYSAHIRVGLRNLALFGEYNFAPIFTNSSSTQLTIFRMGLTISLF